MPLAKLICTPSFILVIFEVTTALRKQSLRGGAWDGDDTDFDMLKEAFEGGPIRLFKRWKRWKHKKELGSGAFGVVWDATDDSKPRGTFGRKLAIKQIKARTELENQLVMHEINAMDTIAKKKVPFALPLISWKEHDGVKYMVFPRASGADREATELDGEAFENEEMVHAADLEKYVKHNALEDTELKLVLAQLALAVYHSHRAGIIHYDIKSENILIDGYLEEGADYQLVPRIWLADFGLAVCFEDDRDLQIHGEARGSPMFMAPEVIGNGSRSFPHQSNADWWSVGVVALELALGYPGKLFKEIEKRPLYELLKGSPADVQGILEKMGVCHMTKDLCDFLTTYLLVPNYLERFSSVTAGIDHQFWKHAFWHSSDGHLFENAFSDWQSLISAGQRRIGRRRKLVLGIRPRKFVVHLS